MYFLAIVLGLLVLLYLPPQSKHPLLRTHRNKAAVALGIALVVAGSMHFTQTARYLVMMPPWVPAHEAMVYASGAAEILCGFGLVVERTRRLAGIFAVLLFVAVFPANLHVAMNGVVVPGLPEARWYSWARLPFQLVYIAWALWASARKP